MNVCLPEVGENDEIDFSCLPYAVSQSLWYICLCLLVEFLSPEGTESLSGEADLEIEMTGDETARAVWQLDNLMVEAQTNVAVRIGATYDDAYVKEKGAWKIKSPKTSYTYRQPVRLEEFRYTVKSE